ncbi:MAG: Ig-like domain-containing protein [Gemmatimonadaceae bacterium]
MSRTSFAAALVVLAAAVGCSSDASGPTTSDTPPTLSIVGGDGQSAGPSHAVDQPLIVQAKSATGNPLADYVVTWTVSGGGQVSPSSQTTDASGQAQAQWTLGSSGAQEVEARIYYRASEGLLPISAKFSGAITASPPTQRKPAILHYDGATWAIVYQPAVVAGVVSVLSIWGSSPSSIFAVGEYCGVEADLRYDGTSWSPAVPEGPPGCTGLGPIENNVSGSSASNVFRIQSGGVPPSGHGSVVQHFDGTNWSNPYAHGCDVGASSCNAALNAVWTDSPNNVVVVGNQGFIVQYNGTSWTAATSGTTANLQAVWGVASAPTPRVFAVGDGGTILVYDGTSWQPQSSGTAQTLRGVWGTSATNVFAVGDGGVILHYDGTTWSTQTSGGRALYGIWGSSPTSVFAVGDGPTVLRYDGTSWTSMAISIPIDLRAVWGSSADNVYAVGHGQ